MSDNQRGVGAGGPFAPPRKGAAVDAADRLALAFEKIGDPELGAIFRGL